MPETQRTRFVHQWWDRSPNGKYLHKIEAPLGTRTPNGAVWGHSTDDLFLIQRIPGVNVVTCWSRSMIKEYGERPIDDGDGPHIPRVRRPYPLLKLDKDIPCPESWMYDCFDEGSDHGDPTPVDPQPEKVTKGKMKANHEPKQDYIYKGKDGYVHRSLQEHIPRQFFPDRLIVTDPTGLAYGQGEIDREDNGPESQPWIYERLYPCFARDLSADRFVDDPVTAELSLRPGEAIGVGNHSFVYRATLTLPEGLSARTPDGKVTVVAKAAFPESEHRQFLHNEAKIFGSFPRHFSEEWCGYNMVSPLSWPVPVGPVVPKFYGYYLPTGAQRDKLSPILLMEECGTPTRPGQLTQEQKWVIIFPSHQGMLTLIHHAGPNATLCTSVFIRKGTSTSQRTPVTSSCSPDLSLATRKSAVCRRRASA